MKEVLKNLEKDSVILLPVFLLGRLLAGAARALLPPRQIGFGGLGAVVHVDVPCGRDTDRNLQLCFRRNQE